MSIKNAEFKVNNGTDWDSYHFKTNSEQVKHTTAEGTETTVKEELDSLNSNLGGLISVEQKSVTLTADWCHVADKGGYYLLDAFNIRNDTNYYIKGIQRPSTGGYTVLFNGANGGQHTLWLIWGKAT